MVINQKAELRGDLIDFMGVQKSNRYSISKKENFQKKGKFRNDFKQELKKTIGNQVKKSERHSNNKIRNREPLKTDTKEKPRELVKENEFKRKEKVDAKEIRKDKNGRLERNTGEKETENHPYSSPEKQKNLAGEDNQNKETKNITKYTNKQNGTEAANNKLNQTQKIQGELKTVDSDQKVLPMASKKLINGQKNDLETVKPGFINKNEKSKSENVKQFIDKNKMDFKNDIKTESNTDKNSMTLGKSFLKKSVAENTNLNGSGDTHQADQEAKNKEMAPISNKMSKMILNEENTVPKKNGSAENPSTIETKANTSELITNGRATKVDSETFVVSKNESQQGRLLPEQSVDKIIKNLVYIIKSKQSEIKIDLKPELLGNLHVEIITKNNKVNITITTDSNHIKEFVENSLNQLRSEFNNNKIPVDDIEVGVNNDSQKENDRQKTYDDRQFWSNQDDSGNKETSVVEDENVDEIGNMAETQNSMIDYYA